mmetsp:Transcript_17994/g.12928  ORF Transcript_17994/g.12928 Transcript_17994/m.12928 type:complete len:106 (-) Transcript_17994:1731-2048(-)
MNIKIYFNFIIVVLIFKFLNIDLILLVCIVLLVNIYFHLNILIDVGLLLLFLSKLCVVIIHIDVFALLFMNFLFFNNIIFISHFLIRLFNILDILVVMVGFLVVF